MSQADGAAALPLSGFLVLDLGRVLAGPSCGQLLADFGADVVRIEDLKGDETRQWPPVVGGEGVNFQSVNRNKRGIAIDLKNERGAAVFAALARKADVLIHSFVPDVAKRLGVDDESMKALNPDLIVCAVSGYGSTGPLASKPGYDLMMQAYTGVMELTGDPEGPPMRAGLSTIDLSTGLIAFGGILLALLARATGKARGQAVQVSLFETSFALLGYHLTNFAIGGRKPERAGSGVAHLCPYQAFQCTDGYLLVGATNDEVWRRLCHAIDRAQWGNDPRFETNAARVTHKKVLIALLQEVLGGKDREYWNTRFEEARVPTAPIRTIEALFDDPQTLATEMLMHVRNRDGRDLTLVSAPLKLSQARPQLRHLPPLHGEHTDEVLRDVLGLPAHEVGALRAAGAVA